MPDGLRKTVLKPVVKPFLLSHSGFLGQKDKQCTENKIREKSTVKHSKEHSWHTEGGMPQDSAINQKGQRKKRIKIRTPQAT